MVDSHAHLQLISKSPEDVIKRAEEQGVKLILCVGIDEEDSQKVVEIAEKFGNVYASVGVHPLECEKWEGKNGELERKMKRVEELAVKSEKVVAIGETGLDFFKGKRKELQIELFKAHLELARKTAKPLVVHTRGEGAFQTACQLISGMDNSVRGVFHSFTWGEEEVITSKDIGFFVSYSGILTFSRKLQGVVRNTPIDWSLVETDSPFLSPHPLRGRENEPANVKYIVEKIAELKGLSPEDVARMVQTNFWRLFKVGTAPEPEITYKIRNSLYINLTIRCTISCVFCGKFDELYSFFVRGHNLRIRGEPEPEEILREVGDPSQYDEIVFCGYGEPTLRLDVLKKVAKELRKRGAKKIRVNTDGLANLVYGRNILPELSGIIDSISVSLNAPDPETYAKICRSRYGEKAYEYVKGFIKEAKKYIPEVIATAVTYPGVDIEKTRQVAEKELGVRFRARKYGEIG